MLSIHAKTISVFIGVVSWCVSLCVRADSVSILGIQLPVGALEDLDSGHVKVTNFGNTKVVDRDQLIDAVVNQYLAYPEVFSVLPFEKILAFTKAALVDHQSWVESLLVRSLESEALNDDQVFQLVSEAQNVKEAGQIFLTVLANYSSNTSGIPIHGAPLCRVAFTAASYDVQRVKVLSSRWIYTNQVACTEQIRSTFSGLIKEKRLRDARNIVTNFGSIYGADNETFRSLLALSSRAERLVQAIDAGDGDGASRALKAQGSDQDEILVGLGSSLAEERGRALANAGDPLAALKLLTLIDFKRRTPKLHQFIEDVLARCSTITPLAFQDSLVLISLRSYALKDDGIRKAYITLLDRSFLEAVRNSDYQKATILFDQINVLRNDPDLTNDKSRIAWALSLAERGYFVEARDIAHAVQTGIPLTDRLKFFFSGMYVNLSLLAGVIFFSLISPILILAGRSYAKKFQKSSPAPDSYVTNRTSRTDTKVNEEELRKFVSISRPIGAKTEYDEYTHLLSEFGLSSGVSLQDIKVAYRNAVKECHPDLNPNAGPDQNTRFIELTRDYERLSELHVQRSS